MARWAQGGVRVLRVALVPALMCLASCARYGIANQRAQGAELSAALPRGQPDYLILRVENPRDELLFLDWTSAHVRGHDGFEVPLAVVPERPLSFLYPAARLEYELHPSHFYDGGSRAGGRRVPLSRRLVAQDVLDRHPGGYRITLRVRCCVGAFDTCWADTGQAKHAAWRTASLAADIVRVR